MEVQASAFECTVVAAGHYPLQVNLYVHVTEESYLVLRIHRSRIDHRAVAESVATLQRCLLLALASFPTKWSPLFQIAKDKQGKSGATRDSRLHDHLRAFETKGLCYNTAFPVWNQPESRRVTDSELSGIRPCH